MLTEINIPISTTGGAQTTNAKRTVLGKLCAVKFKLGTLASGAADVTISYTNSPDAVDVTLLTLTNVAANAVYYPRHQVHSNAGAALTLDGTRIAYDKPLVAGLIKVVVAQASGAQTGNVICYVEV